MRWQPITLADQDAVKAEANEIVAAIEASGAGSIVVTICDETGRVVYSVVHVT